MRVDLAGYFRHTDDNFEPRSTHHWDYKHEYIVVAIHFCNILRYRRLHLSRADDNDNNDSLHIKHEHLNLKLKHAI